MLKEIFMIFVLFSQIEPTIDLESFVQYTTSFLLDRCQSSDYEELRN